MLDQMGILPESSHHEEGPGQNEIDFRYSDPLTAADNSMTFQTVVKTIAGLNGIFADFSPKPLENKAGNGFHINMSVKSSDGADHMDPMIAGILDKISDMTVFLNPTANSYKRFGSNKAPRYISWSSENRSQLIRVPGGRGVRTGVWSSAPGPVRKSLSGLCPYDLCGPRGPSGQAGAAASCGFQSVPGRRLCPCGF